MLTTEFHIFNVFVIHFVEHSMDIIQSLKNNLRIHNSRLEIKYYLPKLLIVRNTVEVLLLYNRKFTGREPVISIGSKVFVSYWYYAPLAKS
jgi:hypothetical protein